MTNWENNEEIKIFQEYLRIPSVHPNVDYEPCVEFLQRQADSLGLSLKIYHPGGKNKPIVVLTWPGTQPELPSILLNSHMDVVPVYPENWTHPPFGAEIDSEGRIFARGTQDMKSVGMQYLAAIRAIKKDGFKPKRTIHISFVPDEEIGGKLGMAKFVHTDDFQKLNLGFSLDEGVASPNECFSIFYAERSIWHIHFKISGTAGHGSLLLENTAGAKLNYLLGKFMEFRQKEFEKLKSNEKLTIGDVTTVNLTQVNGGKQSNVVPPYIVAVIDVRLAIDVDHVEFENLVKAWCKEAGGGIDISYEQKEPRIDATSLDDSNIYWKAFSEAIKEHKLKTNTLVFPGGTDSRYIREVGVPAIGFSPMNNTPILLHDNDEFLKADIYLNGIEIYKTIIQKLANV